MHIHVFMKKKNATGCVSEQRHMGQENAMATFLIYLVRFLAGGLLVCTFAFIAEICKPKRFAGIFSSAPSVLLASLAITLFVKGAGDAKLTAEGAIAGAVGMIFYCLLAIPSIDRFKALKGSLISLSIWVVAAFITFGLIGFFLGWL